MEKIRRPIIKIGGRKGKLRHCQAYYSSWINEIVLNWPWWQREKHLENEIAKTIEHEVTHHVLEHRISNESSIKYDDIRWGAMVFGDLKLVPYDKMPKRLQDRLKRNFQKSTNPTNQRSKQANKPKSKESNANQILHKYVNQLRLFST